jgi:hypothetical protein
MILERLLNQVVGNSVFLKSLPLIIAVVVLDVRNFKMPVQVCMLISSDIPR